MSIDYEHLLIGTVVSEGDIRTPLKLKIGADFFSSTDARAAWMFLLDWYRNPLYKDTPSPEMFLARFPQWDDFQPTDDSITAVCDKVREAKINADIADLIASVGNKCLGDPRAGFEELKKQTARLMTLHTIDDARDVRDMIPQLIAEYERMRDMKGPKLKGKPYPWPAMNEATLGIQDGQLIVYFGRPKSGKTWAFLETMRVLVEHGSRPILFSQELSDVEMARRIVALSVSIDYNRFNRGELDQAEERQMMEGVEAFMENPPVIIDVLRSRGEDIALEIKAKADEHAATVIGIDAANTLGIDVKELVAVTRGVKSFAKTSRLPHIITTQKLRPKNGAQAAGDGPQDGSDAYGSDSYLQDCDVMISIHRGVEQRRTREQKQTIVAIREGSQCMFTNHFYLCTNMTQKEVIMMADESDDEAVPDGAEEEAPRG